MEDLQELSKEVFDIKRIYAYSWYRDNIILQKGIDHVINWISHKFDKTFLVIDNHGLVNVIFFETEGLDMNDIFSYDRQLEGIDVAAFEGKYTNPTAIGNISCLHTNERRRLLLWTYQKEVHIGLEFNREVDINVVKMAKERLWKMFQKRETFEI